MSIKQKLLVSILVIFLIISLISNSVLLGIYIKTESELKKAKEEVNQKSEDKDKDDDTQNKTNEIKIKNLDYTDESQNINLTYPSDWEVRTAILSDFKVIVVNNNTDEGMLMKGFNIIFEKQNSKLEFKKYYSGGFGGALHGLPKNKFEYKVLSEKLVRYKEIGKSDWYYKEKIDCSEVEEDLREGADVCVELFFPKFGKTDFPTNVTLSNTSSEELINEADEIVKSAL